MKRLLAAAVLFAAPLSFAQTRIASDFEIARMQEQVARSRDFLGQLSARLNLGDLYATRNEVATAREEYERALSLAVTERVESRRASDMTRYATATAYAGLAQAKLGRGPAAFEFLEEAAKYTSDSAKTWNLYATAMTLAGKPQKGASAARNAVAIAERDLQQTRTTTARLDFAIYQHTLATALIEAGDAAGAERVLRGVVEALDAAEFEPLRRQIARRESFEIYSTARGEAAAYLSLFNRAQLRLATLLEARGDTAAARQAYERVLERRTDDPTALAALARLSTPAEQARWFAAAFDANPFSLPLIRAYQRYLAGGSRGNAEPSTTGGRVRLALEQIARDETRAARTTLDDLLQEFPANRALQLLRRELDAVAAIPSFLTGAPAERVEAAARDLRSFIALAAADRLTPEQRAALDATTFAGTANFGSATRGEPGQTVLESGTIEGVPFRFTAPTPFFGSFTAGVPLRLSYRILGVTEIDGADALLLEPLGIEAAR